MIPREIENLLVAGKCADGAFVVRGIPSIMAMGQAAGTASALSALEGDTPRNLQVGELQKTLKDQKVILEL